MPNNVEIKARLGSNWDAAEAVARRLAKAPVHAHVFQEDTFFNVQKGRLKLRKEKMIVIDGEAVPERRLSGSEPGTLIAYEREDMEGPKRSDYVKTPVADSAGLLDALTRTCGLKGLVMKERKVYLVQWTQDPSLVARVHLDKVKDLGDFIEFEVK